MVTGMLLLLTSQTEVFSMKGVIVNCLEEFVSAHFGKIFWQHALEDAGLKPMTLFLVFDNIDEAVVMKLVASVMKQANLSLPQLADMFGEYWVLEYSQKMYSQYYAKHTTAKSFLLDMDNLHINMTKNMTNARPPRFTYSWIDQHTLMMKYMSPRNMIDFAVGLIKGVGKFYHEKLDVRRVGADQIQIIFP